MYKIEISIFEDPDRIMHISIDGFTNKEVTRAEKKLGSAVLKFIEETSKQVVNNPEDLIAHIPPAKPMKEK